jgi:hypothetical protein
MGSHPTGVVRENVDEPKTSESMAPLPLIGQVLVPLELWRAKSGNRTSGRVFESRNGTPVDLHNLSARVIIPHVEGKEECDRCDSKPKPSVAAWKSLYSGRRGAITNAHRKEQWQFRRRSGTRPSQIGQDHARCLQEGDTPDAFKAGMKMLEAAGSKAGEAFSGSLGTTGFTTFSTIPGQVALALSTMFFLWTSKR